MTEGYTSITGALKHGFSSMDAAEELSKKVDGISRDLWMTPYRMV
jgi:hypothetical protein